MYYACAVPYFRDAKPFATLQEILPKIMEARKHKKLIRIWSAACSSGQECYSIAMVMKEALKNKPDWRCQIVGTDISEDILKKARDGIFNQFEIQRGLTIQMMVQHFEQKGDAWHIKDDLKKMIQFKHLNLLDSAAAMGTFDIIFCRNVLIYFNRGTKEKAITNMTRQLAPDGYFFLGACETIVNLTLPIKLTSYCGGVYCPIQPSSLGTRIN